jgi:hypothetical protein
MKNPITKVTVGSIQTSTEFLVGQTKNAMNPASHGRPKNQSRAASQS